MPIYHSLGHLPRKRHVAFRGPEGHLCHEQLLGNYGFTGPSSLLYHLGRPTAVRAVEWLRSTDHEGEGEGEGEARPPPRRRHLRTTSIASGGSPTLDRVPLLFNAEVALLFVAPTAGDAHFYRNGEADEYVYVSEGAGTLETQFGDLPFGPGDQLVLHRGILHRYRLDKPARLLVIESQGYMRWPERHHNDLGQILDGAPFSERDIRRPRDLVTRDEQGEFELFVKQRGGLTRMVLAHHPCDVVGWDGYYYPWAFNIHDFEPITGTPHQPPPAQQLLQAEGWALCNFRPRPRDFPPGAVPAPYNHSNTMSDEVVFHASQDLTSANGVAYGSITLHPDGLPRGPRPGREEQSIGETRTEDLAVVLDTFRPLSVARQALSIEEPGYDRGWID